MKRSLILLAIAGELAAQTGTWTPVPASVGAAKASVVTVDPVGPCAYPPLGFVAVNAFTGAITRCVSGSWQTSGGLPSQLVSLPISASQGGTGVSNSATLTLGSSSVNLATLGTGLVKNIHTTGQLVNANASDVTTLFSSCSGTSFLLGSDGFCHVVSPGGPAQALQFNTGSAFAGSASLQSNPATAGGLLTAANSWQAITSLTDGAFMRGYHVAQNAAGTNGGYMVFPPITYNPYDGVQTCLDVFGNAVQQPLPVTNGAFGPNDVVMWNSLSPSLPAAPTAGCPTPGGPPLPVNLTYGLNINTYFFARGGLATDQPSYNSIQSLLGGIWAQSAQVVSYIGTGHHAGIPPLTQFDAFHQGALYWDDTAGCEEVYNGTSWSCLGAGGGGGSGTPSGPLNAVQINSPIGTFHGDAHLTFSPTAQLLTVFALNATSAGIAVGTGYIQSDAGFLATSGVANLFNTFQAPTGGMFAKSFTALNYVNLGNSPAGVPAFTGGDAPHAGAVYWDCGGAACTAGSGSLQVFNGAAWITVAAGGGATTPGLPVKAIQFNTGPGTFSGSANMLWDNTAQTATIIAKDAAHAGLAVGTGFIQSDQGFLATNGVAVKYNVVQAPTGGMAALSFTAVNYTQVGSGTVTPTPTTADTFGAGAMYYNTTSHCLEVFSDAGATPASTFSCVGGGGGGTPGGVSGGGVVGASIQYNNGGALGGDANIKWTPTGQLLAIGGVNGTPTLAVTGGWIQAIGGFVVTAGGSSNYNSIQTTTTGGMAARSFTATSYVQTGQFAGSGGPSATTADTIHPGAMYWDSTNNVERVFNGSVWTALTTASAGVTTLNGLAGVLSILGTPNQLVVTPSGSNITLSLPQDIAAISNVIHNSVTANGVAVGGGTLGSFTSTVTGTTLAFTVANGNFQVNGLGNVSAITFAANGSGGAVNVPTNTATNAIQAPNGGISAGKGFYILGNQVINASGQFLGAGGVLTSGSISGGNLFATGGTFASAVTMSSTLNVTGVTTANGGIVSNSGISATGFNINGGFFGQNWTINIPGSFTCSGTGCLAGSLHNLIFKGGVLVSAN